MPFQLTIHPWVFILIAMLIGLLIGSFINVIIYRLPTILLSDPEEEQSHAMDLAYPPSHCPHCKHKLKTWQLVPLISYLCLRGKCYYCKTPIGIVYPITELACMLLTGFCVFYFGLSFVAIAASVLSYILVACIAIDAKHQLLPDLLTLPGLWCGLLFNSYQGFANLNQAVYGATAGYLLLWLIGYIYQLIRKKPGIGYGDMKMLAMLGAWFGIAWVFIILFIGVVLALISAICMLISKQLQKGESLAFGPYLALAAWLALFLKPELLSLMIKWLV